METGQDSEQKGFWAWRYLRALAKRVGDFIISYPLAFLVFVLLGGAAVLVALTGRILPVGDIMKGLFSKSGKDDERNKPQGDRKDADGKIIRPGESDANGFVQAPATETVLDPGPFDAEDTVVVDDPEEGPKELPLPEGVQNEEVKEVVVLDPLVREVSNNDRGADTSAIREVLSRSKR